MNDLSLNALSNLDKLTFEDAQNVCRALLRDKTAIYSWQNNALSKVINNLIENSYFPIQYELANEESKTCPINVKYVSYFCVGLATICWIITPLLCKFWFLVLVINLISIAAACLTGFLYAQSCNCTTKSTLKMSSSKESIENAVEQYFQSLVAIDSICVNKQDNNHVEKLDIEVLRWFQQLYSKEYRTGNTKGLMEDIDYLLKNFGYKFFEYSEETAEFFDAYNNPNLETIKTTEFALFDINNEKKIVLGGKVVFPV